jgi:hypothetical protein
MTTFTSTGVLGAILAAAFLQDLAYTAKTVLVSRGMMRLAVAADVFAMVASSLYLILTASVTIRSGLSIATVEAFAAIAVGGAGGTLAGMFAASWLEATFTRASLHTPRVMDSQKTGRAQLPAAAAISPITS